MKKTVAEFELREGDLLVCEGGELDGVLCGIMSSACFFKRRCISEM